MRWLGVSALLLVVLAIAEVVVFIVAAKTVGLAWALLAAVATSVLGAVLLRREGARGWRPSIWDRRCPRPRAVHQGARPGHPTRPPRRRQCVP